MGGTPQRFAPALTGRGTGAGRPADRSWVSTDDRPPRLRHDPARRRAAGGAQPLRGGQARHRGAPRRARRRLHRGRLAGREPQGHRVLRPGGQPSSTLRNATLAAFGATRRAGGARPPTRWCARLLDSRAPVVTLVAKSHTGHVERALRTTLEENLAMIRDTVSFLRGEGRRVFLDAEHFFDGYAADRDYALEAVRGAMEAGAEVVALCDTNGGMLPGQVADVVADVVRSHRCAARHPLPQRHRLRRGQLDGRRRRGRHPRAGHHQRLRRAHRQRRPADRRRQPPAQARAAAARAAPAAGGDPDRPRDQRGHQRARRTRRQPYVGRARSRTRRACTPAPSRSTPTSTSTPTPSTSATTCGCWCPTWPAAQHRAEGARARLRPRSRRRRRRDARAGAAPGSRTCELRGYTFDAADASFELLLRRELEGRCPTSSTSSRGGSSPTRAATASALSEATVKVVGGRRAGRAHRRGQRPGQRPRPGPAPGARAGLPGAGASWS